MRVKIVRNTVASGQPVFEGETHDLPDNEAKFLIALGKAVVESHSTSAKSIPSDHDEIETADLQPKVEKAVKPNVKKGE